MAADGAPRQIPGFYYDSHLNRYFKLAHASTVTSSRAASDHTPSNVAKKQRVEVDNRRRLANRRPLDKERLFAGHGQLDWRSRLLKPLLDRSLGRVATSKRLALATVVPNRASRMAVHSGLGDHGGFQLEFEPAEQITSSRGEDTSMAHGRMSCYIANDHREPGQRPSHLAVDWRMRDIIIGIGHQVNYSTHAAFPRNRDQSLVHVASRTTTEFGRLNLLLDLFRLPSFDCVGHMVQLAAPYTPTRKVNFVVTHAVEMYPDDVRMSDAPSIEPLHRDAHHLLCSASARAMCPRNHWSALSGGALADLSDHQDELLERDRLPPTSHNISTRGVLSWHTGRLGAMRLGTTTTDSVVTALAALGNGWSAVGCRNGSVGLFDSRSARGSLRQLFRHSGTVCALASPDWQAGQMRQALGGDRERVPTTVDQISRANQLVCKSINDELKLWDLRYTARPVMHYRHYRNRDNINNRCLAFFGLGEDPEEASDTAGLGEWQPEQFRHNLERDKVQPQYRCPDPLENDLALWRDGGHRNFILTEVTGRRALAMHSMDGESYFEVDLPSYQSARMLLGRPHYDEFMHSNGATTRPLDDICVSFGRIYTSHAGVVQEWAL